MSGDRITLEVRERTGAELGSRNARRLRREGLVPGVLYGKGHARAFVVGERDLRAALTGPSGLHAIVDIVLEGQKTPHHAVLKEFQQHPIRGTVTHIDFHEVRLDQPIQAVVAVRLTGEAPGSKVGGVVQQVTRELHVQALPADIPEYVDVALDGLDVGDALRLESLAAIDGVTFLDDPHETVIATCSMPRGLSEAEEGVEGEEAGEGEGTEDPAAGSSDEAPAEG